MSEQHTYAGHTLAAIKAAAESMPGWNYDEARRVGEDEICEFGTELDGEWYPIGTVDGQTYTGEPADDLVIVRHIVTANPAAVLAMAARIEDLEREKAEAEAIAGDTLIKMDELERLLTEARHANTHAGLRSMYQRAMHDLGTACLEGWNAAREQAMGEAKKRAIYEGGNIIHDAIRSMQPPTEWVSSCACGDKYPSGSEGAAFITAYGHCENCDAANAANQPWPHPDGFAGGLTEPSR